MHYRGPRNSDTQNSLVLRTLMFHENYLIATNPKKLHCNIPRNPFLYTSLLFLFSDRKCYYRTLVTEKMFPRCLPVNMASNEDVTAFNKPGWIALQNEQYFRSDFKLLRLCPKPWRYHTAKELNTDSFHGQTYSYSGGGYVADLGYTSRSATEVIDNLEKNVWIDDKTAAVFVEFTVFEPSTSLISTVKFLYEQFATGGTATTSRVKTLTLYSPADPHFRGFYELCQLILILLICLLFFRELVNFARAGRSYLKHFWNWVELVEIVSAVSSLAMFFLKEKYTSKFVKNVQANPFETSSTDHLVLWSDLEIALLSFVIFIVTIKLLRIIRFNRHVCQMMATLKRSCKPLVSFSVVFLTALLGFTHFGYVVFGSSLEAYSTYFKTLRAMLVMTLGGRLYFNELISIDQVIAPSFLFLYMLVIGCILVNLFVTILMDTYAEVADVQGGDFSDADLGDFMAEYILECIKSVGQKVVSSWKRLKAWRPKKRRVPLKWARKENTIRRRRKRTIETEACFASFGTEGDDSGKIITVGSEHPPGLNEKKQRERWVSVASMDSMSDLELTEADSHMLMLHAKDAILEDAYLEVIKRSLLELRKTV